MCLRLAAFTASWAGWRSSGVAYGEVVARSYHLSVALSLAGVAVVAPETAAAALEALT
ncbi:hypothetical protein [Streptomyces sp. RerS4]|uniref:hypothetical protein n=1 Tax=Streptomyces sp. RerS4 TaxID=2942449 RepID=UPI00201BDD48|nr:hypothetical protein [Streptomyces sp. RerS4]UQW99130.1 hypothetical protein M4D82_00175 [Streptomyces sp. RerS4]